MRSTSFLLFVTCLAAPPAVQASSPASAVAPASPVGLAAAPAKAPFEQAAAKEVIGELARQLEESFVFPEVAKAYSAMLRSNLAAGAYAGFADADAFAEKVTADLQAIHEDRHLRLQPPRVDEAGAPARRGPPPGFKAISKAGWLAPGVAYIRFELFPGDEATLAELRRFIDTHKDAKSLIIDARTHRGGGLAEMDMLFPEIFARPTVLVGMDTRVAVEQARGSPIADMRVRKVAGPEGVVRREHYVEPAANPSALRDAKVYLLTSGRSASAAEHLSLSLKRTGRATLVGETTRGAGHYGGTVDLPHGYAVFIPVGRTFDPDTGEGWEGVGVKPDVAVAADKALDEALRLAGVDESAEVALASLQ